jgi:two-component system LytT family sensor kinase
MSASFQSLPRWILFAALWLLLTLVFSSQLYWSGYLTPWTKALGREAAFWLAWAFLWPAVFWLCRHLYAGKRAWKNYLFALLFGAIGISFLQAALVELFESTPGWIDWWFFSSASPPASLLSTMFSRALKLAGWNATIFAATVLAWHAATYYRESRDRQLKSAQLESDLRQAQLQALRGQLSPHFLFNTLHSMAELIHENPVLAEQMLIRLGTLLRRVLQTSATSEIPLAEELEFIKDYVEIEQMRLGDRLLVKWEIAGDVLQTPVPSLILQPLVENAIQHGIAPTGEAGTLAIRARRDDRFLRLQVRDDGPGLSEEKTIPRGNGTGLANTRDRLRRIYGDTHGFDLANDGGLVVDMRLPLSNETREISSHP